MRIVWISFLDAEVFSGGAELAHRSLLMAGRRRGHEIEERPFLRTRSQRLARRVGLHRSFSVDFSADAFVLANIRNAPSFPRRLPETVVEKALATGRAAVFEDAWVDVCPYDLPCDGDTSRCQSGCDRSWADLLYSQARAAIFVSPMQREVVRSVVGVSLPSRQILCRPIIDVDLFERLDLERDIDVLYVGTINEAKGYGNLLERFGPDRITFVGRNMLGSRPEGTYLGEVPHEDLPHLYNRARTFAHLPRWLEPQGRAPVEAALCGCEVILNERVGVSSYPEPEWTDPRAVRENGDRFWRDFEAVFEAD